MHAYNTNTRSTDVLSLMASMYRRTGRTEKALQVIGDLLELDPLNFRAYNEKFLIKKDHREEEQFIELMRGYHESYLELAVAYGNAGMFEEALNLLERYTRLTDQSIKDYPLVYYFLGYYNHLSGNTLKAGSWFGIAAEMDHRYCFPFRFESARALETALEYNPNDALAWYLIGNIYYDHQPERAIDAWERSVAIGNAIPVAYRNLAFAHSNINRNPAAAAMNIEQAIRLNPADPRYHFEYDHYHRKLLTNPFKRIEPFLENHDVVINDLISIFPYAELLTLTGRYDQAIELMGNQYFYGWEGGVNIYQYWIYAHLFKTRAALENNQPDEAERHLDAALSYPLNLRTVISPYENIALYYRGLLAGKRNDSAEAAKLFGEAARSRTGAPEVVYFAASALVKLNDTMEANKIFGDMIKQGLNALMAEDELEFFDPSPRIASRYSQQANNHLRIALGFQGLGDEKNARKHYSLANQYNPGIMSLVFNENNISGKPY
jgi:hypothetical protein